MKIKSFSFALLMLTALLGCKKDKVGSKDGEQPIKMAHGVPNGAPVVKMIGSDGGQIRSGDGAITVDVPAGAVSTEVQFKITPISKTLSSSTGAAFRLEPEGINFQKDISITFNYSPEDLVGTTEDYLYMAYQDKEGFFRGVPMTAIDKAKRTLTAKTRHFSDWYITRLFFLAVAEETLSNGESTQIALYFTDWFNDGTMASTKDEIKAENLEGWSLEGPGTLSQTGLKGARFTAPSSIPEAKTTIVKVKVKNMFDRKNPDRPGTTGMSIVLAPINLEPDEFFTWSFDGSNNTALAMDAALLGTMSNVLGTGLGGNISLMINASKPGEYELGNTSVADKFGISVFRSSQTQVVYQGSYRLCGDNTTRYGAGKLVIEKYGNIGGFISGYFTATVYAPDCSAGSRRVIGSFKIRRKV
jgi:hypothetical protein